MIYGKLVTFTLQISFERTAGFSLVRWRKLINYITRLNMKATGLFTIQIYSLSIQQLSICLLTFLHALALKRV